jgi:hypothetical protein
MDRMLRIIIVALCFWSGAAAAATMTFNGLPTDEFTTNTWTEDGITAKATWGGLGSHSRPDMAHIDDGGSSFASGISFVTGGLFEATSFDIHALTSSYCSDWDTCGVPFDNVVVEGWRDGMKVAKEAFSMGADWSVSTYLFGSAFDLLDRLVIRAGWVPMGGPDSFCMDSPCAHFDIDNVTLQAATNPSVSAVPLPPAIVLMLSAIGATFSVRLLRRAEA